MKVWNTQSLRNTFVLAVGASALAGFVVTPHVAVAADKDKRTDANDERSENRDFLKKAYQAGLAEIETGRLAREEATNADVKKFASMMVIDHQKANEEIKAIAEARHMTLDEKLSDADDKKRDKLAKLKGEEFDKRYIALQVEMHNEAIQLFKDAEKDSKDPKVDQFVKKTLPSLREHHERAQTLLKDLK